MMKTEQQLVEASVQRGEDVVDIILFTLFTNVYLLFL